MIDERYVATGAADIDGDEIVLADMLADERAADRAGGGAGQEHAHRPPPRDGRRAYAAARLHDLQGRGHTVGREVAFHTREIRVEHRFHVRVECGDGHALVFAECRIDIAR